MKDTFGVRSLNGHSCKIKINDLTDLKLKILALKIN